MKKTIPTLASSEITPESTYVNRRRFMEMAAGLAIAPLVGQYDTDEKQTPYKDVTTYNNFYEFGIDKDSAARNAIHLRTQPWKISIEGFVKKPQTYALEDLIKE